MLLLIFEFLSTIFYIFPMIKRKLLSPSLPLSWSIEDYFSWEYSIAIQTIAGALNIISITLFFFAWASNPGYIKSTKFECDGLVFYDPAYDVSWTSRPLFFLNSFCSP